MKFSPLLNPNDSDPVDSMFPKMRDQVGKHGVWVAFQNHDLGSAQVGRTAFMVVGPDNTYKTIPSHYPDTPSVGLGWRYLPVGFVDLKKRTIIHEGHKDWSKWANVIEVLGGEG